MMKICYLVKDTNEINGANKVTHEHANRLAKRDHNVLIVSYGTRPKWFPLKVRVISVPKGKNLSDYVLDCDIVVATPENTLEAIKAAKKYHALPFYFFQDSLDMFHYNGFDSLEIKQVVLNSFRLPFYGIYCPSIYSQKVLLREFGITSTVIPNAVDRDIFTLNKKGKNKRLKIVIVGTDEVVFKGIADIYEALVIVKDKGFDFDLVRVSGYSQILFYLKTKYYISPSQKKIAEILSRSDIFISGSYCESFSLPPLEAMNCGAAVITADNGGVKEYAVDGYNSLIFKKGNIPDLAGKIVKLITDKLLREHLIKNGLKTAGMFNWENSIAKAERMFEQSLKTKNTQYFKMLNAFQIPENTKVNSKKNLLENNSENCLYEKNKFFLESKINRNCNDLSNYFYLAQVHFNLAVHLISRRKVVDRETAELLLKVKKICREHLITEKSYIKQVEDLLDYCNTFLLFKNKSLLGSII